MKTLLALLLVVPSLALAQVTTNSASTSGSMSGASNQGVAQSITFSGPSAQDVNYSGSYSAKTTGAAVLPGFSGSFSSDYCGATAGAAAGGLGFSLSFGVPKIDPSCVLLRAYERTMQAASSATDGELSLTIRSAALEILAEVDPKVKAIFARKKLIEAQAEVAATP